MQKKTVQVLLFLIATGLFLLPLPVASQKAQAAFFPDSFYQAFGITPENPISQPSPQPSPSSTTIKRRSPAPSPSVAPSSAPSATPKASPSANPTTNQEQYFIDQINKYRAQNNLGPVKTDSYTCDFAKVRAKEITTGFNHDGFTNRVNSKTLPYPSYHQITENIAMTSNYTQVVTMWINSPGHAENMRQDTPYVCVESSGNYFAYEGWRP